MKILLTEKQTSMLMGEFALANGDSLIGNPGIIAGQFFEATDGNGFFEVGYISGDNAKRMLQEMGIKNPKVTPPKATVYTDID